MLGNQLSLEIHEPGLRSEKVKKRNVFVYFSGKGIASWNVSVFIKKQKISWKNQRDIRIF